MERHDFPGEDVVTVFGDVGRFDEAERIREVLLGRVGRLDAIVASLGRGCHGPSLVEASFEMRERALGDHLTSQCVIAHMFLPLLIAQGNGDYTLVKRTAMERAVTHVDPSVIVETAQDMLVRVLSEELADTYVRFNKALVYPDTSMRKRARDPPDAWSMIAWEQSPHGWLLRNLHRWRDDDSVRRGSIHHS